MNLIKNIWTQSDKIEFVNYLNSLSKGTNSSIMEKKIANTKYPCVAVSFENINYIVKQIYKGNYISFINLWIDDNLSCINITGKLIAKIKDFNLFKSYALQYLKLVDCWASTDCLKLNISKKDKQNYFDFALKLICYSGEYYRRFGLIIMFKLVNDDNYIDKILSCCNKFANENSYYVNMALSWLLCDCFIKQREKTYNYILNNKLNNFVFNKFISKCCDSYRVSDSDKLLLKSLKK